MQESTQKNKVDATLEKEHLDALREEKDRQDRELRIRQEKMRLEHDTLILRGLADELTKQNLQVTPANVLQLLRSKRYEDITLEEVTQFIERSQPKINFDLLLACYSYVEARKEDFAKEFYARLFVVSREAETIFKNRFAAKELPYETQLRRQEASLMATLKAVAIGLKAGNPETAVTVKSLGYRHRTYGVVEPHLYDIVGVCLIETFRDFMKPAFTPDMETSWKLAYQLLKETMAS